MSDADVPVGDDPTLQNDPEYVVWTSDSELGLAQARRISGLRGATVAMFLGEVGVGKTTILVELWTDLLLHGRLGDAVFGGSATSIPFEERSFQSRIRGGSCDSYTLKTNEDDDGFLHLRLGRSASRVVDLFLSDLAGEHFTRVREGAEMVDEFDWASRVDRFVVVIDGRALNSSGGGLENGINRATRLLAALTRFMATLPLAGRPRPQLRLVLAKDDSISPANRTSIEQALNPLLARGKAIDMSCEVLRVAARPSDGRAPYGLIELIEWLTEPDDVVVAGAFEPQDASRAFGRFRNG